MGNKPVKILGVYFAYDENKNKYFNFKNYRQNRTGFMESHKFDPV